MSHSRLYNVPLRRDPYDTINIDLMGSYERFVCALSHQQSVIMIELFDSDSKLPMVMRESLVGGR